MRDVGAPTTPELSHLPLADETWEATCPRVADLELPRPISGWALIVMESASGQIEALEPLDVANADTVADIVIASFLAPEDGNPRQPLHLRVPDADLARALQERLHAGPTTVELAPTPAALERLTVALTLISASVDETLLFPTASAPSYFRAAAALYRAKPWLVLRDNHTFRLDFPGTNDVFFAYIGTDENDLGVTLFRSEEELDSAFQSVDYVEQRQRMANTRSILYTPERDVSERWSEQRRHSRWVIAEPDAFPLPAIVDDLGVFHPATDEDLWILAQAAAALAGFVVRNRKRLANNDACSSRIDVTGPAGKTAVEVTFTPIVDEIERALEEILTRAIRLPNAEPILQRLRWTFYRGPEPMYAEDEDASSEAAARFASWAVFASHHFAVLYTDSLRAIAHDIHLEEAVTEALVTPRISFFAVVESKPDTLRVRDRLSNDVLIVRRRRQDPEISEGELIVGALHNTGRGDYVMYFDTMILPEHEATTAFRLKEEDRRNLGPAIETICGANTEWIDELPRKAVRDVYEEFRHALNETGDAIPSFATLQKTIATADSPTEVLRDLLAAAQPWGVIEADVLAALFKRIWNITPRPDLGGRSPEQVR